MRSASVLITTPGPQSRWSTTGRFLTAGGFVPCKSTYNRNEAPPMATDLPDTALELRSLVTSQGTLELSLHDVPVPVPGDDEVLVRIEASPINPSDLGLLTAGAEMAAATVSGTPERPVVTAPLGAGAVGGLTARLDQS